MSTAGNAGSQAMEAAKRKSESVLTSAKDAISDAPASMKSAAENPKQATVDFLHTPAVRTALPFINGGLSGMAATFCIQPIDMIKVRLQLAGEGVKTGPKPTPFSVGREVIASGKVLDLYTGLSAGMPAQPDVPSMSITRVQGSCGNVSIPRHV